MTATQLKSMVRTIEPIQKLLVIEERNFKASNTLMDEFEATGNLKALDKSVRTSYVCMRAMRDAGKYRISVPKV